MDRSQVTESRQTQYRIAGYIFAFEKFADFTDQSQASKILSAKMLSLDPMASPVLTHYIAVSGWVLGMGLLWPRKSKTTFKL